MGASKFFNKMGDGLKHFGKSVQSGTTKLFQKIGTGITSAAPYLAPAGAILSMAGMPEIGAPISGLAATATGMQRQAQADRRGRQFDGLVRNVNNSVLEKRKAVVPATQVQRYMF